MGGYFNGAFAAGAAAFSARLRCGHRPRRYKSAGGVKLLIAAADHTLLFDAAHPPQKTLEEGYIIAGAGGKSGR